jgi:hypothetical protein
MGTAVEIMTRQLEVQAREITELRSRAGPPTPKLEQLRPYQQVSHQELALLREAQVAGKYDKFPGQLPVVCLDMAGRPVTTYFGDPGACWNQFNIGHRYVRGFNTNSSNR